MSMVMGKDIKMKNIMAPRPNRRMPNPPGMATRNIMPKWSRSRGHTVGAGLPQEILGWKSPFSSRVSSRSSVFTVSTK